MRAKKNLGQNFLADKSIAKRIVAAGEIKKEDNVWEIGPGKGVLTEIMIQQGCRLTCFEIDSDLIPGLHSKFGKAINLINADILKIDWQKQIQESLELKEKGEIKGKNALIANIPYSITSPLLDKLLLYSGFFDVIILMLQKEVAQRLASSPGNKNYGALTIKAQFYFDIKSLFKVSANRFRPRPKVDSMVVSLKPRAVYPLPDNYKNDKQAVRLFWQLIEACFHSRRKTIKNNLKSILSAQEIILLEKELLKRKPDLTVSSAQSGKQPETRMISYDLSFRGEQLSETDYINLCDTIIDIRRRLC